MNLKLALLWVFGCLCTGAAICVALDCKVQEAYILGMIFGTIATAIGVEYIL